MLGVFGQVGTFSFIDFDDDIYVYANARVQEGLTAANIAWAFTGIHANNWHPLTTLSLLLDASLFGVNPAAFHLVNLFFHVSATLLLLLAMVRMTLRFWPSLIVAALFGLHPLHVESVAWVSERKDVLCAVFWMLTLLAYHWYTFTGSARRYLACALSMVLCMLAKPMAVTLPFVLLLLDFWPLARTTRVRPARLIGEKLPFFLLVAGLAAVTFLVQEGRMMVKSAGLFPWDVRIANALVSYAGYLAHTLWPTGLAIFYPHPGRVLALQAALAAGIILAVTAASAALARRAPYLVTGWLWYLGTLVPVIGIVQVGMQAHADRYTYLPLVGVFIMLAWGVPDALSRFRHGRLFAFGAACAAIAACSVLSWAQTSVWRDSVTLYTHAARAVPGNYWAYNKLGYIASDKGMTGEAIDMFRKALAIQPDSRFTASRYKLGIIYYQTGRFAEAVASWETLRRDHPSDAELNYNLGLAYLNLQKLDRAKACLERTIRLAPSFAQAHQALDQVETYARRVRSDVAAAEKALASSPGDVGLLYRLALLHSSLGQAGPAVQYLQRIATLKPDNPDVYYNLACMEARRNSQEAAVAYLRQARDRGFSKWDLLNSDPDLLGVRDTPGVRALMQGR